MAEKSYYDNVQETVERLDMISPTMCMAKWLQVSMHLPQGLTQSCYHPPTHTIPLDELTETPRALHNTREKVLQRKKMWEGERPEGCQYCWNIEDTGNLSDRHYRSSEWWVGDDGWNEVVHGGWDENINPRYVEVNFNQACNFKCIYCSPHLSTEWEKEIQQHGPIRLEARKFHNNIDSLRDARLMPLELGRKENPYVNAFWDWWPELYPDLKVFRMTGGEPLMDKNTFKIFDYIVDQPNHNMELSITSNLCPPDEKLWDNFMAALKRIEEPLDKERYQRWIELGHIREVDFFAVNPNNDQPTTEGWPRYVVEYPGDAVPDGILTGVFSNFSRMESKDVVGDFDSEGIDRITKNFKYKLAFIKRDKDGKVWDCLGSNEVGKRYYQGIHLAVPRIKNFMLFASIDSIGEQAEYIRSGLDWETFQSHVHEFIRNTEKTQITFINTFNLLSIPKLREFLEYIASLRRDYPVNEFQRIWFDIPYLRGPNWLSAQNAVRYPGLMQILYDALSYMESQEEFMDYEIAKLKRDIAWIETGTTLTEEEMTTRRLHFWNFIHELDHRRDTSFIDTFPELGEWYNDCYATFNSHLKQIGN